MSALFPNNAVVMLVLLNFPNRCFQKNLINTSFSIIWFYGINLLHLLNPNYLTLKP